MRWACDVKRGRHVINTVVFDDCRNVTVGDSVRGSMFVWRLRRLNFLGVSNGDRFIVISGGNDGRSRKNVWCWGRDWSGFAKQEGVEGLDGFHFWEVLPGCLQWWR
jgi:hypothetical protein